MIFCDLLVALRGVRSASMHPRPTSSHSRRAGRRRTEVAGSSKANKNKSMKHPNDMPHNLHICPEEWDEENWEEADDWQAESHKEGEHSCQNLILLTGRGWGA